MYFSGLFLVHPLRPLPCLSAAGSSSKSSLAGLKSSALFGFECDPEAFPTRAAHWLGSVSFYYFPDAEEWKG